MYFIFTPCEIFGGGVIYVNNECKIMKEKIFRLFPFTSSKVQYFNVVKKWGLWMITVTVIFWYWNGNQVSAYIKNKDLIINIFIAIDAYVDAITPA